MTMPVLREFLEQNADIQVVIVSRENFESLFQDIPNLVFKGVNLDDYKGFFGLYRLAKQLIKEYQPDMVADLHDVIRTKILNRIFRLKGYRVSKINKGKEDKEHLTDIWNLDKKALKISTERYADVLRNLGFSLQLSHKYRPVSSTEKKGIGFAPFAQHKGKMLPLEKSFELAKILSQKEKVYFFGGGKKEVEILQNWEQQIPNTESFAGKLSLNEELKKISELSVMISMDSANMHLASLVGTRCISVWGSTHYFAGFLGYGQKIEDIVQVQDLTCRPCSVFGDK
ncbi:MAG: glycosyltransferase family 9 protein, partial [Cruoricaptor ignavus]|nr:glycosyltransferase family 9 protein [Cruoricaptor ignavus]